MRRRLARGAGVAGWLVAVGTTAALVLTMVAGAQAEPLPRQVRVVAAEPGSVTTSRTASVTIEPSRDAQVAAKVSGQVARVLVREGGRVEAGQAVLQVDDSNLRHQVENARIARDTASVNLAAAERATGEGAEQAVAALRAAEANRRLAETRLAEARQLLGLGAVAATEVAGLEAQLAQAVSAEQQASDAVARSTRSEDEELELRRLQLRQAENQLAQAYAALEDAKVKAPFAGVIAQVHFEEGEFLAAGSPAFRLVDDQQQRARFSVPPQDAQALLAQGMVHIPFGGLDYAAQVTDSSDVPGQTRLVEIRALIYPSRTRIPNGTVTTMPYQVPLAEGIVIPAGAIRYVDGQPAVLVVRDGRAEGRSVTVRAEGSGLAVVEGVSDGDLLVFPLPADLIPGSPVEVIEEATAR